MGNSLAAATPAVSTNGHSTKPTTVLVTTPHETCDAYISGHLCDTVVRQAAEALVRHLAGTQFRTTYIHGDINRSRVDLNRRKSRGTTGFRRRVSDVMKNHVDTGLWLLDVHSYPGVYADVESECVVLLPYDNPVASEHGRDLAHYLSRHGVSVLIYQGGAENDLMAEATSFSYTHVFLLEFSEHVHLLRLHFIAKTIVEWMSLL
jgi:hypothetical protein